MGVSMGAGAGEWIINPELVVTHSGSEPLFLSEEESHREVASPQAEDRGRFARQPDQYLEVLKVIPESQPKIQRSWLDYKVLHSSGD